MDKKMDIASQLNNVVGEFEEFVNREFVEVSDYFDEKIENNVRALLTVDKPKVMVYGIYNSGKSTLINSLCKEEVAEVADRPMTSEIAEYDRGDYYLVDSPGIDAPIEHELVTEDYLNKCHIILFVMSSKGLFEEKTNYDKLAKLIKKDIPFIIVLNDRGIQKEKKWSNEEKKRADFEHDQELKLIQYKIIDNLIKVSKDKHIADKYEVITINARKAWTGIVKKMPKLYEDSEIEFLDTRIEQLLVNERSIGAVFKQPISNLKECLNEIEKIITKNVSGNLSDDFEIRMHTFEKRKDNIMEDLRILTKQTVQSHLDELTNSYVTGDPDTFETIALFIFQEVEERYSAKLKELLVFVERNFRELNIYIDATSNINFDFIASGIGVGKIDIADNLTHEEGDFHAEENHLKEEKIGLLDLFFKSRRERKKRERLEDMARLKNEQEQYKVQENIRKKQEARQLASSDLDILYRQFSNIISDGIYEKYDDIVSQIQEIDCINKERKKIGECQMKELRELRKKLAIIENSFD